MTKAAQLNLAESLYFDFKKLNIKISVINPGFIDTESTRLNSFWYCGNGRVVKYSGSNLDFATTLNVDSLLSLHCFNVYVLRTPS